jgi:hypothetical protein
MNFRCAIAKRFVALLVISLTCLCLAEDLLAVSSCAEDRRSVVFAEATLAISQTQSAQQSCPSHSSQGDHDCFCCCRHVVPGVVFQADQSWSFSFIEFASNGMVLSAPALPPYHPPQA